MELDRFVFEVIDSTNSWAKANVDKFHLQHLTVISADSQTGGYGRHGRNWVSPSGKNLYLSFCFRHAGQTSGLTAVAALGVAQALELLGLAPCLKWPNDLFLSKKKVCGILCEVKDGWAIVGIGLNVNMTAQELVQVGQPATSLLLETSQPQNIKQIQELIEGTLSVDIVTYLLQGLEPFYAAYRQRLMHKLGDAIQIDDGQLVWRGTFHKINIDGSLSLIVDENRAKSFYAGDMA